MTITEPVPPEILAELVASLDSDGVRDRAGAVLPELVDLLPETPAVAR